MSRKGDTQLKITVLGGGSEIGASSSNIIDAGMRMHGDNVLPTDNPNNRE
jgi:hypothetical protein